MKKQTLVYILMLVFPVLAAVLAAQGDSVMVLTGQELEYYSFHDQIPGVSAGICFLMSVLLNDLCIGAGVVYGITKKPNWLKGIRAMSFVAMTLAVLPILMRGETTVLPDMWIPLLMGAEWAVSWILLRKPMEKQEKQPEGPRLNAR